MLVKCGAVRMTGKSAAPTAGDGNGESRHAAAGPVDGPALLPTDGKVGAGIQPSSVWDPIRVNRWWRPD